MAGIEIDLGNIDWNRLGQRSRQRQHDLALKFFYEGKLKREYWPELELAIAREQAGEVKPLGAPIPNLRGISKN